MQARGGGRDRGKEREKGWGALLPVSSQLLTPAQATIPGS